MEPEVLTNPEALSLRVADWLLATAVAKKGRFSVALSGGETPRRVYELLASEPIREAFPWSRTHWFWGDERFVPHDDSQSNYGMAWDAMLSRAPVPRANIHPITTEGIPPEASAADYEARLGRFYAGDRLDPTRPLFDVTFLGLGPDGHTASLFPGTAALLERHRWVAAVLDGKAQFRITLTYPALESSGYRVFLVTGAEKKDVLDRLRRGDPGLPATRLASVERVHLFADAAAAGSVS